MNSRLLIPNVTLLLRVHTVRNGTLEVCGKVSRVHSHAIVSEVLGRVPAGEDEAPEVLRCGLGAEAVSACNPEHLPGSEGLAGEREFCGGMARGKAH